MGRFFASTDKAGPWKRLHRPLNAQRIPDDTDDVPLLNAILGMSFDPAGNLFVADSMEGPLRIDAKTGELSAVGEYPDEIGSSDVCVKRHEPFKGHLLVCGLAMILVSEEPVFAS